MPENQVPNQKSANSSPLSSPQAQMTQRDFINPNNFAEILNDSPPLGNPVSGHQPQQPPQDQNKPLSVDPHDVSGHYEHLTKTSPKTQLKTTTARPVSGNETLKLIIYIVPVVAILFQVMRPNEDKDFLWHVRNSLVTQGVWFMVIIALNIINLPIISGILLDLWRIVGYGMLIYAGAIAYNHGRFKVPLAYDAGRKFIEDEI